ncbi:hypothetical protein ABW19_dt0203448 [Dactylella cylindrospora]|nr:hypothetical protein ABW19_dt0203448 [Dactylella cylindrospora]
MSDYEAVRLANIERNKALLKELEIDKPILQPQVQANGAAPGKPLAKRRKLETFSAPTRSSARISAAPRPSYKEEPDAKTTKASNELNRKKVKPEPQESLDATPSESEILAKWKWKSTAPIPTRDEEGTLHFQDYPDFLPNKTPEEIIREGCFGGSYFRPLYSKKLNLTIENDYQELPDSWLVNLDVAKYLTSPAYQSSINKYGVACGQSIEEWEANGWINHEYDVRGWFQWYIKFYQGRRCEDDERQVGRWKRCCGEKGRWRRTLLKKYVTLGVREVFNDAEEEEGGGEVSPVVHQTCHHWAWEVRQPVLDAFWEDYG